MMNKFVPILFLFSLFFFSTNAQIPAGYYDNASGKSCAALKSALKQILINSHTPKPYDSLYNEYKISDVKPREVGNGSANVVWDIYSDVPSGTDPYNFDPSTSKCGNYSQEGDCYNREHTIPQSWFSSAVTPGTDFIQILPVDGYVNGKRGNFPYGKAATASYTSKNGGKLGTSAVAGVTGTVFEPIDEYKGDLARIFFYFVTRYQDNLTIWPGNSAAISKDTFPSININYLKMMLDWNAQDPVSQKEIDRNNNAYTYQHDRNPFVDHPEYVGLVWNATCPGLGSLPINIIYFTGTLSGNTVTLKWQTANPINFSNFELQKSFDGNSFYKIATLNKAQESYTYADNISNDRGKNVYYRLKKIDKDGSFSYSAVFSLKIPAMLNVLVYPNPAKNFIKIQLKQNTTSALITICDLLGKTISTNNYSNTNGVYTIPVNNLAKGVYFIKIDTGSEKYLQKIVISN